MDLVIIAGAVNITSKIAEYFGLIEGTSTNVRKLLHQAFISAKDNLEYAGSSTGENQINYVMRAKDCFIDAVAVEENENKILALVGLSVCQYFLRDIDGAQRSLDRIQEVNLSSAEKNKALAADVFEKISSLNPINRFINKKLKRKYNDGMSFLEKRIYEFEAMKKKAIQMNNKLIEKQ